MDMEKDKECHTISFARFLEMFNDFVYTELVKKNKNFCLTVFGDELITKVLPINASK